MAGGTFSRSILPSKTGGGGGAETIESYDDLPDSPNDEEVRIFEVVDGEPIFLIYDSALSGWVVGSTFGEYATLWDGNTNPFLNAGSQGGILAELNNNRLEIDYADVGASAYSSHYLRLRWENIYIWAWGSQVRTTWGYATDVDSGYTGISHLSAMCGAPSGTEFHMELHNNTGGGIYREVRGVDDNGTTWANDDLNGSISAGDTVTEAFLYRGQYNHKQRVGCRYIQGGSTNYENELGAGTSSSKSAIANYWCPEVWAWDDSNQSFTGYFSRFEVRV